jgi:hypothetical protein
MPNHVGGEGGIGVSPDAQTVPFSITKVKPNPRTAETFDEEFVLEMPVNRGRERLIVSKLAADWGGRLVCVRFWLLQSNGTFKPTARGLNIRVDYVEAVAAAMVKAVAK